MKKNKKRYNFTEKQKRRDRFRSNQSKWFRSVPGWYCRMFNREYSAKCKVVLRKILNGEEIEFPRDVKDAGWYYW